ncbi:FAD-binding oxidoreductase [Conexibacter sp. CPCC 206217]|uniref:NAD(P)/FAD-dependent oxidoreductase n=1 Tax=Conexibacter sp. CPCC 206217 TaxID=3064574 RepID=UPI002724F227|nr:FAD-dependent oxidoreductase [Conexibacter sp. CPCC 206217]MDO8209021.1 FAD-dependent oxidoreductase [Conexibacter sp. CPCC 206217]
MTTNPAHWLSADATTGDLPAETDVLIVGGGIAGVALAYYLAGAGTEVVLVERDALNREASGTNAGSMHLQIAIHQLTSPDVSDALERLTEETRLAAEAFELWAGWERELDGPIGMHVTGGLMVAETPEQLALLRAKQPLEAAAGLETHVVEGEELRTLAPFLSERVTGATHAPAEGHVDALRAVPLLALRAVQRGARIRTSTAVTGIDCEGADGGGPFRVRTSAGTIRARRLVNAAGAWANQLAALAGGELPMIVQGLHVNVTEPRERFLKPLVQHIGRRLTLKQAYNGTFIIGGGWPSRAAAPPQRYTTMWQSAAGNADVAVSVVPALADVRLLRTWSGVIAWTPDVAPLLGESRRTPGLWTIVAGSSGYTMSPLFARMLAESMSAPGSKSPLPAEYSPDRPPARPPARA